MASKSIAQQVEDRKARGAALAAAGQVEQTDDITFRITGKSYIITLAGTVEGCSCEDFLQRSHLLGSCKHLYAAKIAKQAKAKVQKVGPDSAIRQAVSRLAWEKDRFATDCLKALVLTAQQQQMGVA